MYDGSMLSYEENVKNTAAVARVAHAMGVDVEAELGHVGFAANETDQDDLDLYTKVDGSGVPDDQLEKAFTMGINKFNVGTEYFYLYFQTVKEYCQSHEDIFDMQMLVQERLQEYLRKKLQLCTMTV